MAKKIPDLGFWMLLPTYMLRSPKLTKDEKILAMSLMVFVDPDNGWKYNEEHLVYATALSKEEIKKAIENLKNRELLQIKDDILTIGWGFAPHG
jgi:hypothetical protein